MNTRKRIALGLSSTVLVLGAGRRDRGRAPSGRRRPAAAGGGPPGAAAIATYLGLTAAELRADLAERPDARPDRDRAGQDASAASRRDRRRREDPPRRRGRRRQAHRGAGGDDARQPQSHVDDIVNSTGPAGGRPGRPRRPGRRPGDAGDRRLPRPDGRADPHRPAERPDARADRDRAGQDRQPASRTRSSPTRRRTSTRPSPPASSPRRRRRRCSPTSSRTSPTSSTRPARRQAAPAAPAARRSALGGSALWRREAGTARLPASLRRVRFATGPELSVPSCSTASPMVGAAATALTPQVRRNRTARRRWLPR